MLRFRHFALAFVLISLARPGILSATDDSGALKEEDGLRFRWAFVARVGPDSPRKLVSIGRKRTLHSGDEFKMLVEFHSPCHVYVIYRGIEDETSLLFPPDVAHFAKGYETFRPYYIPAADNWFELDDQVGREQFYLLASAEPLTELEALLLRHKETSDQSAGILAEVRRLRRVGRKLTGRAEMPLSIAGTVRGNSKPSLRQQIDGMSFVVRAKSLYDKSFTIHHR